MSVKFKIGFTIAGETLFALMSKMLPIEDLSVEELAPSKIPQADRAIELHQKRFLPRKKKKRFSPGPNFKKGINGIVLTAMKDKPLRTIEMQSGQGRGFLTEFQSIPRLRRLRDARMIVERVGDGRWRLKDRAAGPSTGRGA